MAPTYTHVSWPGACAHSAIVIEDRKKHLFPSNGLYLKPTQPSVMSHAAMHSATVAPTSSPSLPSGLR